MSVCTFFGHGECYDLDVKFLYNAIEELIEKGVDEFYVGHQGHFDGLVFGCLKRLKEVHRDISVAVVLAYLPTKVLECDPYCGCSIYPEGLESVPPRFAIEKRNRWMIDRADFCLCYIDHTWGGAYKFAKIAERRGLEVVNIGGAKI